MLKTCHVIKIRQLFTTGRLPDVNPPWNWSANDCKCRDQLNVPSEARLEMINFGHPSDDWPMLLSFHVRWAIELFTSLAVALVKLIERDLQTFTDYRTRSWSFISLAHFSLTLKGVRGCTGSKVRLTWLISMSKGRKGYIWGWLFTQ
jgi:hypothetical protein